MIKATQNEARPPDSADNEKKQLVCWNKDAQAQSLRVELSGDSFFVFPYTHLTFAKMEREESREVLTVSFTTHDLQIAGRNLRELGIALQKMAVDWIKAAPARYAALASKEAVFIESVEVKETADQALS
jgi:hypothetical protein